MVRNIVLYVILTLSLAFSPLFAQALQGYVYQYDVLPGSRDAKEDSRVSLIKDFLDKGWDVSAFSKTQRSRAALYASVFYVPRCNSSLIPFAFQVERNKAEKYANIVLYEGNVVAPRSGWFRFVGTGDDMLLVNIGGQTVLESGYCLPSGKKPLNGMDGDYQKRIGKARYATALMPYPDVETWNEELGGLTAGVPFCVEKDKVYNVKILYVDMGGAAGYCLLVEHLKSKNAGGKGKAKLDTKKPLDIFRVSNSLPEKVGMAKLMDRHKIPGKSIEWAVYSQDSLVWTASSMPSTATIDKDGKSRDIGESDSESGGEADASPRKKKHGKKGRKKSKK